jgi:hypothetical protein
MDRLCMIMHLTTLYAPCIAFMLVSHTCIIVVGHAEQGPEETSKPAQAEGVNPEQDQGKPQCIYPPHLSLFYCFIS